jgi:ABC transport system ATP-binding/permease protein
MALNYLSAENIGRNIGEQWLFKSLTFGVLQGEKVALIGANGSGKTTLLDVIAGKTATDEGSLSTRKDIRTAYLDQNPEFKAGKTVIETLFDSENAMTKVIRDYEIALATENHELLAEAMTTIDELGAWDYEARVKQILGKLGIQYFDKLIGNLSGGQQKRVALARVLIDDPEFLILDEPTNHLDLDTIEWLEGYLSASNITLLLVTHDRYFLDKVCNRILELDGGAIHKYMGSYAYFLEKRAERQEMEASSIDKAKNQLRKELDWMRRQPKARSTKAQYRIDAFYDLKDRASQGKKDDKLELSVKMSRLGSKILEIKHISKNFGEQKIISEFDYTFKKGDRIGIVGKNGMGKSTLLEIITEKLKPDTGTITKGETVTFGYYHQGGLDFREDQRVLDVVLEVAEFIQMADGKKLSASGLLTLFLFPPAKQYTFVNKLSGGEKRRLQLMKILIQNPNFLILDEPTNDLDIATLNVLEEFLENFAGCLLVVSHDRYFMDKLVEHLFVFEGEGKIRDFAGNYTDYRFSMENEELTLDNGKMKMENVSKNTNPQSTISTPQLKKKLSFKEQREYENLEKEIADFEQKKAEFIEKLNAGSDNHTDLRNWAKEIEKYDALITLKSDRWLELAEFM